MTTVLDGAVTQQPPRMDTVFGFGLPELLIIAVVLVLLIGMVVGLIALVAFVTRRREAATRVPGQATEWDVGRRGPGPGRGE